MYDLHVVPKAFYSVWRHVTSGVTDGRAGPPGSSDAGPFLEMGPLIRFLCFLNKFINLKPLVYTNLFFATATVSQTVARERFWTGGAENIKF